MRELVDATDFERVEQALLHGQVDEALHAIPFDRFEAALTDLKSPLGEVMRDALNVATARLAEQVAAGEVATTLAGAQRLTAAFEVLNPRAQNWLSQHAAELVTQVSDETRRAIRRTLTRGYADGLHPTAIARDLRARIGLTDRQAGAVDKLRAALAEQEVPEARIQTLTDRYADRLLANRAENIARTESLEAMNGGQRAIWQELEDEGAIDRGAYEREWMAIIGDSRTCPICEALDGKRAPIGGQFVGGVSGAPAHNSCRCTERLVPKGS